LLQVLSWTTPQIGLWEAIAVESRASWKLIRSQYGSVSGHDFSRAINGEKYTRASAPAGYFR
jgi:hypothetical protein